MTGLRAGNRRCISQSSPASAARILEALKRIACQESNQTQFRASADGGIGPALISSDNGVGIFQITNTTQCPDPFTRCPNTLFNWISNIEEGIATFQEKVGAAKRYPATLRASADYGKFIDKVINPARAANNLSPIHTFPAPEFTTVGSVVVASPPNQLLRDAVRGYNGFGTSLKLGGNVIHVGPARKPGQKLPPAIPLHEFIPDMDFLEKVPDSELPRLNTNPQVWKETSAELREQLDQTKPDQNYVDNVAAKPPTCPL